jgi:hypothetical protein
MINPKAIGICSHEVGYIDVSEGDKIDPGASLVENPSQRMMIIKFARAKIPKKLP